MSEEELSTDAKAANGLLQLDEGGMWLVRQRFADDMLSTKGW